MIVGLTILLYVAIKSYQNAPPIPKRIVDPQGNTLFTGADINAGQEIFLKYGLMEHGTLLGHGAYLGPDYSAEYLHSYAISLQNIAASEKYHLLYENLSGDEKASVNADEQSMYIQTDMILRPEL